MTEKINPGTPQERDATPPEALVIELGTVIAKIPHRATCSRGKGTHRCSCDIGEKLPELFMGLSALIADAYDVPFYEVPPTGKPS